MSFNTFCGQDPTNAATYNRVLLRFQEGGGGGGDLKNEGGEGGAVMVVALVRKKQGTAWKGDPGQASRCHPSRSR